MKKSMILAITAIVLVFGLLTVYVQGSDPPDRPSASVTNYYCPKHPEITASWPAKCPRCGANLIWREPPYEQIRPGLAMGGSKAEIMRHKVMMNTGISVFDPQAILGAAKPLHLTAEQIEKFKLICMTARQRAREVLTESQRRELSYLENLPNFPRTMAERREQLMQRMLMSGGMMRGPIQAPRSGWMGDPTSDPPAEGMGAELYPDDLRNNPRDQLRDRYRDTYRDMYRDRLRDNFVGGGNYMESREFYPYNNPFNYYDPYYNGFDNDEFGDNDNFDFDNEGGYGGEEGGEY